MSETKQRITDLEDQVDTLIKTMLSMNQSLKILNDALQVLTNAFADLTRANRP